MAVYALGEKHPRIHPTAFVHPLASIIGDVEIGPRCYIGPGASLRGDWPSIRVGAGSNIQDSCTVHAYPGVEVVLGEGAHLGHGCVIHGARLGGDVLIGMNAVVQDEVVLGEGSIVGAGCVVPHGLEVPARSLVVGVPGRIAGEVTDSKRSDKRSGTAGYRELADRCLLELQELKLEDCLMKEEP